MIAYGWIVVNRWLVVMWADINEAREMGKTSKHLSAGTDEEPQAIDAVCPTQKRWPLACPCVDRHPTSEYRPALGITLIHLPARLILNWIAEYEKFVDVLHRGLGLRLRVLHAATPPTYELKSEEAKRLWGKNLYSSRYIVVGTYPSWKQVQRLFTETISWEEEVPGLTKAGNQKKPITKTRNERRLYPAQQIMDECHETKDPTTGAMSIFHQNTQENPECKTLFISGTPWSQSPGELAGIFGVLATTDWPKHKQLQYACDEKLKDLVASYKRLLQKESEIEATPKLQTEMRETTNILAGILELIMLRRTSDSKWVNGPIIDLTDHQSSNVILPFPKEHRSALSRLQDIDKQKEAQLRQEWQARHPGQEYRQVLNQYFRVSYKQRAVATIPGLATLLERNDDLDLTWSNYTKQGYLADSTNPFLAKISMLTKCCPKFNFIVDLICKLKTMKAKVCSDASKDYEVLDVPEKLVVVSTNPVVCAIFEKVCLSSLNRPVDVITVCH